MKKRYSILLWILAFVLMAGSAIFQRMTGPTHPVRGKINIEGQEVKYKLIRSQINTTDGKIAIPTADAGITGVITYRRYKSHDPWEIRPLQRDGENLVATIPKQPAAGKVMYQIILAKGGNRYELTEEPVIIRFRGDVPAFIMISHILFMFLAMMFSLRVGLEALFKGDNAYRQAVLTTIFLFLGGIILGPIMQKYAFGAFWTGWPFGHDLTDNKTAVAFIFWLICLWQNRKDRNSRKWYVIASVVTLAVYLIPHSLMGSELDHTKVPQ